MKKINFKQPKYILPAFLYFPLLGLGWLIIQIFQTEIKEKPSNLQTTEYLNSELPDARVKEIGSKRENMLKSFGKISDESAVSNIGQDSLLTEDFGSKYSEDELNQLNKQLAEAQAEQERLAAEKAAQEAMARDAESAKLAARQDALDKARGDFSDLPTEEERIARNNARQKEMFEELERELGNMSGESSKNVLNAYRRRYGDEALPGAENLPPDTVPDEAPKKKRGGFFGTESDAVNALDEDAEANAVVKKRQGGSSAFNTISENEEESQMLRAIIDEEIKVVDGSRVRLRLLDDAIVNGINLKKGSYLYALMSGFSKQRIQGKVESVLCGDELVKISLSVYDLDGLEGLYVPGSQFRETSKEVLGSALQGSMNVSSGIATGEMLTNFAGQALQNAYQRTSSAIAKAIKKNKVRLKYGTHVYLLNSKQQKEKADPGAGKNINPYASDKADAAMAGSRGAVQQAAGAGRAVTASGIGRFRRSNQ